MNKYYLLNLSIEVALANADFDATQWRSYMLPRSRGTSLQDPHVKFLVEFFFPDLYDIVERAELAYQYRRRHESDPHSMSNWRFTANLKEGTLFWLQDAVVLLKEFPKLAEMPPWSTMLLDDKAHDAFKTLSRSSLAKW